MNYGKSKCLVEIDEREVKSGTELLFASDQFKKNDAIEQLEFNFDEQDPYRQSSKPQMQK